ncbi:olfactory receptor 5J3-like [Hyperolius riggenbachi]|uniref:olfactory receptor 5J3-like n=1 Tax=Hyperolius riggenbachi TaxID=752182 RepID=UPI0035A2E8F8
MNHTHVTRFELSALTDNKKLALFLFIVFLLVYLVTIYGNVGIVAIVHISPSLHTPMYYFLTCLSVVDLFYSSVITPKMLMDLLSEKKYISYIGCILQFFFFAILVSTEVFILTSMAYDRYVAICHPLQYVSIMVKSKCQGLILTAFSISLVQSTSTTSCMFNLQYCGPNLLDNFYCDVPQLLKLSCSDTHFCDILTAFFICLCTMSSLTVIMVSYVFIVLSIKRMKSTGGRQKAFSTCSSHVMCATLFYATVFFTYLHPSSTDLAKQDKVGSVFYTMVTPMLNPLIYSLRNQEVKRAVLHVFKKCKHR